LTLKRHVFVISDLHIGGRPEVRRDDGAGRERQRFQICHDYSLLAQFVEWVTSVGKNCRSERVELVINGDIVDFLSEDDFPDGLSASAWTPDEKQAITKLKKVMERSSVVFEALQRLVASGVGLTLILGNHDVELALPSVREFLTRELEREGGHVRVVFDGEAYRIGPVLIEHGNKYDPLNLVAHGLLNEVRWAQSRKQQVTSSTFDPPVGSRIVVDLLNPQKQKYRFLDLLRPLTSAIGLLLMIEPSLLRNKLVLHNLLSTGVDVFQHAVHDRAIAAPFAGVASPLGAQETPDLLSFLDPSRIQRWTTPGVTTERGRMDHIGHLAQSAEAYIASVIAHFRDGALSKWHDLQDRAKRDLHAKICEFSRNDQSYNLTNEDDTNSINAAKNLLDAGFQVVIFGHTHAPKKVDMNGQHTDPNSIRRYINTGTWADVMRIPASIIGDFDEVRNELDTFINQLATNHFQDHLRCYPTHAEIVVREDDTVESAELYAFCSTQAPRQPPLTDMATGQPQER